LIEKEKGKDLNNTEPIPAQDGPTTVEARPRPRAADFADKNLSFWVTISGHFALLTRVADSLHKGPWISIPLHRPIPDGVERGRAPASSWTGQTGQGQVLPSGLHQIPALRSVSPLLISRLEPYSSLPTVTASREDIHSRS
jgi:hypothetical protein